MGLIKLDYHPPEHYHPGWYESNDEAIEYSWVVDPYNSYVTFISYTGNQRMTMSLINIMEHSHGDNVTPFRVDIYNTLVFLKLTNGEVILKRGIDFMTDDGTWYLYQSD